MKYFKAAGFSSSYREISCDTSDDEFDDDDIPVAVLVQQFRFSCEDFDQLVQNVPTEDDSDEWECNLVQAFQTLGSSQDDDSDNDSEVAQDISPGSELSHCYVLQILIQF